jgi:hypothetical protein
MIEPEETLEMINKAVEELYNKTDHKPVKGGLIDYFKERCEDD